MKKDNRSIHLWKGTNWLPEEYRTLTSKTVLVVDDIQNAIMLSLRNKVVFLTADKEHSTRYNTTIIGNEAFGKDDTLELIGEWKIEQVKQVLDKYNMFDVAIMNPPYDKNLHLKILEAVIPHAEKVVNISPNLWFTRRGSKQIKTFRKSIANHIVNHAYISTEEAHDLFPDTTSWMSLSILTCSRSNEKCAFNIDNYWKTAYNSTELSILEKACSNDVLSNANIIKNKDMRTGINIPLTFIAGGRGNKPVYKYQGIVVNSRDLAGNDFLEMWNSNPKHTAWKKHDYCMDCLMFETTTEAKNFYDSWNTKFMTWLCGKTVQQQHIKPEYLPYMSDYSQPWTDQRFYEFFKLTPEEIKTIEEYVQ